MLDVKAVLVAASLVLVNNGGADHLLDTTAVFEEVEEPTVDFSFLQDDSVAVMGDSITTYPGYGIDCDITPVYPDGDVDDVSDMWWNGLNVSHVSGVSGSYITDFEEDSEDLTFRSSKRVGALGAAATVIVYGGTCDLLGGAPPEEFDGYYRDLVTKIKEAGTNTVVLCTLPPLKADNWLSYNDTIRTVAKDTGCLVCEFSNAWTLDTIDEYTIDGVHPNATGMKKLNEQFRS